MSYIIGIDTGGTYTDIVILDRKSLKLIKKSKAFTTKENLIIGIKKCFENLDFDDYKNVDIVCMSTTLATNAIVENIGCKVGTIIIGKVPSDKLPDCIIKKVAGENDIRGYTKVPINEEEIKQVAQEFKGKIEALVISGYASVRNPNQELQVKNIVKNILDIPIVCAHELTSKLGYKERTVTAILNARLIPIIKELIYATKDVLEEKKIDAALMVVEGDGCLINYLCALEKPITTILSGPASSMIGGIFLSDVKNALIMDIGGTTTDIAKVVNGKIDLNQEGANVGGWLTRVNAANIYTFGLGGDSRIFIDKNKNIQIGPERVWPFCLMYSRYTYLLSEIKSIKNIKSYNDLECYMLYRKFNRDLVNNEELKILNLLESGPHNLNYIKEVLNDYCIDDQIKSLIKKNYIIGIGFTPTDLLHIKKLYCNFNSEISEYMLNIFCELLDLDKSVILDFLIEKVIEKIVYIYDEVIGKNEKLPIVAIGAPSKSWMQLAQKKLNTEIIVPDDSEVANAVGAAVGKISKMVEMLIRPNNITKKFILYAISEMKEFNLLEEAKEYAINKSIEMAGEVAMKSGCCFYEIYKDCEDVFCKDECTGEQIYIETKIKAVAIGLPSFQ